jgi:hypothetical protein
MAEELALFEIILSAERGTEQRLKALDDLQPFLQTDEAVHRLAGAVRAETSVEVRERMVELLCSIDIARLTEREEYIGVMTYIAALEPEGPIRLLGVMKLALLAPHIPVVQDVLAETLISEFDPEIRTGVIMGLINCNRLTEDTIAKIETYIEYGHPEHRSALLHLVQLLPPPHVARLVMRFLDPFEKEDIRLSAIQFLTTMPALDVALLTELARRLQQDPSTAVRAAIIQLLATVSTVEAETFRYIFEALAYRPDQSALLDLVTGRLTANQHLIPEFTRLFEQTRSAGLKIRLLTLLQVVDLPALLVTALNDANPYVREAAIPLLKGKFARWQTQLESALVEALRREPLVALRRSLADVLLDTGRKLAETEALLPTLAIQETDRPLKIRLATAATRIAMTEANRTILLTLFAGIMEQPWYPEDLREEVSARLLTFAYRDEPELKKSLGLLLEQAKDIWEVERLYEVLKTLETDFRQLAPSLLRTLYRHIAYYPQQPLHDWVQLLGKQADVDAEVRAQLPYVIALTGANWLLEKVDKADQATAFLPAIRSVLLKQNGMRTFREGQQLLNDAWQKRTVKKSDVIELYRMLLTMPKPDAILHDLLTIMQTGQLVTPELIKLSLDYCMAATDQNAAYGVQKYLQQSGFIDLSYRDQVLGRFTQAEYDNYQRFNAPVNRSRRYTTLNDWEYQGWFNAYGGWPIATLAFAMEPGELVFRLFEPPTSTALPSPSSPSPAPVAASPSTPSSSASPTSALPSPSPSPSAPDSLSPSTLSPAPAAASPSTPSSSPSPSSPPPTPAFSPDTTRTLQYLVLEHLFRNSSGVWAKSVFGDADRTGRFLTALYGGFETLPEGDALRDRIIFTFWKKWNEYIRLLSGKPVAPGLADAAARIYAAVNEILKQLDPDFNGKQYPEVLKGINPAVLREHWPWSAAYWDTFEYKYFPKKDPDQEPAEKLYQQAAKVLQGGDQVNGYRLLKELVSSYSHTRAVKERLSGIQSALVQLEAQSGVTDQ